MKKILFILIVVFLGVDIYAQREVVDTLFESSGAVDTTVFRIFKRDVQYFTIDIGTMADNDTLSVGYSTDRTELVPVSNVFPLKLTKSTYLSHIHGALGVYTKYRIGIEAYPFSAKYVAIRVKCAGACSPSLRWNP